MSLRANPTGRQVRLGLELKKLRERAGVTARDAARAIGVDPAKMTHLEAGRVAVSEERVRRLVSFLEVSDANFIEALVAMTAPPDRGWWEKYRGVLPAVLLDLAELEHHARCLRSFQVVHIPGLLQTEAYTRAIFAQSAATLSEEEVEANVQFRRRRREALAGRQSPVFVTLHEAALRMKVADRRVMRGQLEFMLATSDNPAMSLKVVPFSAERFTGAGFSMHYMEGVVRQLDTAQFDTVLGSIFVDAESELADYRRLLDRIDKLALSETASRDLIKEIAAAC